MNYRMIAFILGKMLGVEGIILFIFRLQVYF